MRISLAPASILAGAREALASAAASLWRLARRRQSLTGELVRAAAWVKARPGRSSLAAVGLLALTMAAWRIAASREPETLLLAAVREGPFEVKIVESGTLEALRSITYSSAIPGNQAKIIFLVPEGSSVREGDLLVGFDPTPFEEEARRTEAQLAQAKAERQKAEQDLKLQLLQNQEQLAEARDKLRLAELELASVEEGRGKLAEAESEVAVANARRELEKAISYYEDLKPLLAEGFITQLELDRGRQAVEKVKEDLKLLEMKHRTYLDYTRPAEVEGARAALYNRKEALRQIESASSYRLSQAQAALSLAIGKVAELEGKLALQKQNLAQCQIRATVSGMVIYKEVFFGSEKRKVQVGDQVWSNQPLITLPELSQMVVETGIRETDIYKVEKNQKVAVSVDAYPELKLSGRVSFIGTLAQEEPRAPSGKYFQVVIQVEESDPRLRPGMSARLELLVEQIPKALYLPLEAVFEKAGRRYCYVLRGGKPEVQEVLTGKSNDDHIVVEAGLDRGEQVLLRDPTEEGRPLGGQPAPGVLDFSSPPSSGR